MKFIKQLVEFSDASGTPLSKIPVLGGKELDLHLLFTHVSQRGGYEEATANRWGCFAHAHARTRAPRTPFHPVGARPPAASGASSRRR